MASIRVDLANGSDGAVGSVAAPVKNLYRAIWQSASGDSIICSGTTLANPHRARINIPAGVTIKPSDAADRIHISCTQNISNGSTYEDPGQRVTFHSSVTATVTITIASPGVVSWAAHTFENGRPIVLSTTGALPTGLVAGTQYYVVNQANGTFQLSATFGGAAINTSGSQSGTQTATASPNGYPVPWEITGTSDTTTANVWGGTGVNAASLLLNNGEYVRKTFYMLNRRTRIRASVKMGASAVLTGTFAQTLGSGFGSGMPSIAGRYGFNFSTGLWDTYAFYNMKNAAGVAISNAAMGGDWVEFTTQWVDIPTTAAEYNPSATSTGAAADRIHLQSSGGDINVGYIITECQAVWTDIGSDVYSCPFSIGSSPYSADASLLGRTSTVSGITTAVSGVFYATDETDLTTYRISEGATAAAGHNPPTTVHESHRLDTGTPVIKFKTAAGTPINNYSLYATTGTYGLYGTGGTGGANVVNATLIACQHSVYCDTSATWNFWDLEEYTSLVSGCEAKGTSTINLRGYYSEQPENVSVKFYGGGVIAGSDGSASIATVNVYGGSVVKAGDDAYQPIGAGIVNIYGCTALDSTGNDIEVNGTNNPAMTIRGFSGNGTFRDQSASTSTVDISNSAFAAVELDQAVRNTSTYTIAASVFIAGANVGITGGATSTASNQWSSAALSATLGYTSDTDLTPTVDSDLYGTGVKWWANQQRPIGADGEPFPDFHLDVGGIQSKHYPLHPVNL